MRLSRQILVAVVAVSGGLIIAAAAGVVMLEGAVIDSTTSVPWSAMTGPMIAVIVFWLFGRFLGVPLEPVRTFLYGALVVYGTLYFLGRVIAAGALGTTSALVLAVLATYGFGIAAVHFAFRERLGR